MEPGSLVTHVPMVIAAVSHHAVQALVGAGREQPQTEGSPADPRPLDVGIVSVRLVTGLVRRLSVLVGMRRVGTGRPVIVGRARHRIVRGLVVARIVRGLVVGIVSVRPVTGLVRRSSVLVGICRVGTGRPVIVGRARHRIVRGPVVARIVRGPRPQVTSIARSIAPGWSVRATP